MTVNSPDIKRAVMLAVAELNRLQNRVLPVKVGENVTAHVKDNFRRGQFAGERWQDPMRKRLQFHGAAAQYGPLLSGTNHLMNANTYKPAPGKVTIENRTEYAGIHNEGGHIVVTARMKGYFWYRHRMAMGRLTLTKRGKVGNNRYNKEITREALFWRNMALKKVGSVIRMPKRQFLGSSPEITRIVNRTIAKELQLFTQNYGKYFKGTR